METIPLADSVETLTVFGLGHEAGASFGVYLL